MAKKKKYNQQKVDATIKKLDKRETVEEKYDILFGWLSSHKFKYYELKAILNYLYEKELFVTS